MKIFSIVLLILLTWALTVIIAGCTYSVTLAHTQGVASDLIDETQSAQADVKPNIEIPGL